MADEKTPTLTAEGLRRQEQSREATMRSARAAREAAEQAGAHANAAAANAAKKGSTTSEFKATMLSIGVCGLMGALEVLSHTAGPWQVPAAVIVGAATAAGVYSAGRAKVKAAALQALPMAVDAQSGSVSLGR